MRIVNWPLEQILEEVKNYEGQCKQLRSEILRICWYMRGSVTLAEAYAMEPSDRSLIADLVKENMETTKKSGLPFF